MLPEPARGTQPEALNVALYANSTAINQTQARVARAKVLLSSLEEGDACRERVIEAQKKESWTRPLSGTEPQRIAPLKGWNLSDPFSQLLKCKENM
jgi:hypothetical protein